MIVVVSPDNETGFRKHLEEITYSTNHPSRLVLVKDKGSIALQEIQSLIPDLTIIGGRNWIKRNYDILEKIPGKKGILFVSPLGQNEISQIEAINFKIFMGWLDEGKIDYMFLGSKELVNLLNREDVLYLPAPFAKEKNEFVEKQFPAINSVAILHDKAIHKNTLNAIAGVANSTKTDAFVVNGLDDIHKDLVERFGLTEKTKDVGFLSKKEYYTIIDTVKILLHLSYSEGLCYGALEALYRGTPVLVSNAMPWFYHPLLWVSNQADHEEIGKKIDYILSLSKEDYLKLCYECRIIAEKKIAENNLEVQRTLQVVGINAVKNESVKR